MIPEAAAVILEKMRAEGVEIVEDAMAEEVSEENGQITVKTSNGTFTGSHMLMAVGRKVNIDKLDLEKGNVDHDRAVKVDAGLRSVSNRKVYAIGDAAGGLQFTHVAGYHAGVIIRSMLFGLPSKAKSSHIPWVTYTDPELAQIGPTEVEARKEHGDALTVARFDYDENDRAIAFGKTAGFIKVMVVKGKPDWSATIVGEAAGELIGVWALAIANGSEDERRCRHGRPLSRLWARFNKQCGGGLFLAKAL